MIIQLMDKHETQIDVEDYGVERLFHYIPSADISHTSEMVSGVGEMVTGTTISQRTISVKFGFKVSDIYDYYLLRDELNALFMRQDSFYIIFKREPYKRWIVRLASQYQIPPHNQGGEFTIEFKTVQRYAESVGDTLDMEEGKEWDQDLWWWNDRLTWDEPLSYVFTDTKFSVMNLGTWKVDPAEPGISLDIRVWIETTDGFKIKNLTNGSEYEYEREITTGQILDIIGVRSILRDGSTSKSVFHRTTMTLLTLSPGENKIEITGGNFKQIQFVFRYPFI